jgi:hypothetical protein
MKSGVNVIAVLVILAGGVFFLQGINVLPGSSMTGQAQWAVIGGIMVIAGAGALWYANRQGRVA